MPTSELKRLNNIFRDSEFHALSRVKVPARPGTALREILQASEVADIHGRSAGAASGTGQQQQLLLMNSNGWMPAEHAASSGGHSNGPSSLPCSSGVSSPVASGAEEDAFSGRRGSQQKSREVRKARRLFRSVDKELASIKMRNDAITLSRTGIEVDYSAKEDDEDGWDDIDEVEDEEESLLQEEKRPAMAMMPSRRTTAACCALCLVLVLLSVGAILWFADRWYDEIREEELEAIDRAKQQEGVTNQINS